MLTIQLHNLIFLAHHGIHAEEQLTANSFEVSLDVVYDEKKSKFNNLDDTIDYVVLYNIVKDEMKIATPLLEKICKEIISKVKKQFPVVEEITISIKKLNLPIENFHGSVGVSMKKKFD
ncbi:MAG TPA: dihydroneopterin aldolase [Puia sp.]|nr:dihydroneopterin aldolase [Puia sp.]